MAKEHKPGVYRVLKNEPNNSPLKLGDIVEAIGAHPLFPDIALLTPEPWAIDWKYLKGPLSKREVEDATR